MKHRKVDILNPKNIYCAHCRSWRNISANTKLKVCCCADSKKFNNPTHYWERCPEFEWSESITHS